MDLSRIAVALWCAGCLWPLAPRAAAQGAPYSKTELIRLLGAPGVNRQMVAVQVGLRCVSFVPTARDLLDLRAAGADSTILNQVASCGHSGGTLRIVLPAPGRAPAGSEATLEARLVRGTVPQPGVRLVLRGASALPGGSRTEPAAVTDAEGVARFRVATGTRVGTYAIEVATARAAGGARATWELTVTGGHATRADVRPTELVVAESDRTPIPVRVLVRDVLGNRVVGAVVEVWGRDGNPLAGVQPAPSDSSGTVTFALPPAAVATAGPLTVVSGGRSLALIHVQVRTLVLSREGTRFTAGMDQRGAVGTALPEPLVFTVHDAQGGPMRGYPVEFTPTNATIEASADLTDANGEVRIRVTLGQRAGPAGVSARAGDVTREALFYAFPGEPRELVVQRPNGDRLPTPLEVATRDPVALRVQARDAYGNAVPAGEVEAVVEGEAVRVGKARQGALPGTIALEPRHAGSAVLTVRAAGLEHRVPLEVFPLGGAWLWGARLGGVAFSYDYRAAPNVGGRGGVRAEFDAGRRLTERFRLQLALAGGSLGAITGSGDVTALLWQAAVRVEYALARPAQVVPIVTVGGGAYRLSSTDQAGLLRHTSAYWTGGAGVDVRLGASLAGEARVSVQRLMETTGGDVAGVGWLTLLDVGVRFAP